MRVAADTNILLRLLVGDDPAQLAAVKLFLETAGTIVVSNIVLVETVRVLARTLKYPRGEIAMALRSLSNADMFEFDRQAAEAGIAMMERGGDFSDGIIMFEASRLRCDQVVTFDRNFARAGGRLPVVLLG
jgi:predicted nucleic-acid-binding protein